MPNDKVVYRVRDTATVGRVIMKKLRKLDSEINSARLLQPQTESAKWTVDLYIKEKTEKMEELRSKLTK